MLRVLCYMLYVTCYMVCVVCIWRMLYVLYYMLYVIYYMLSVTQIPIPEEARFVNKSDTQQRQNPYSWICLRNKQRVSQPPWAIIYISPSDNNTREYLCVFFQETHMCRYWSQPPWAHRALGYWSLSHTHRYVSQEHRQLSKNSENISQNNGLLYMFLPIA